MATGGLTFSKNALPEFAQANAERILSKRVASGTKIPPRNMMAELLYTAQAVGRELQDCSEIA